MTSSKGRWLPAKHLLHLNERIVDAVLDPKPRFLMVEVSVRHGKSFLISKHLPPWYLGLFPHNRVILATYSDEFSAQWGLASRDLYSEWAPTLFGTKVSPDQHAAGYWTVDKHDGGMRSVGVGGTITGEGGNLIIIDDPIKNIQEATSPTYKKRMKEWYDSTLRTRLEPGGTIILAMARWAHDDLSGRIQDEMGELGDQWEIVNMPALAEAPVDDDGSWRDVLGRSDGEALWPERYSTGALEQIKASVGAQTWESLYQQNPTPREGGLFKTASWRYVDVAPPHLQRVRRWDLAATEGGGDETAGVLMGRDHVGSLFVLDVNAFRRDPAGVEAEVYRTAVSDGKQVRIRMEQEGGSAGKSVIQSYARLLAGWDFSGSRSTGPKAERVVPWAAAVGNEIVYLVRAPWNTAFVEQHRQFPAGRHDDQVDAAGAAFSDLAEAGTTTLGLPPQEDFGGPDMSLVPRFANQSLGGTSIW